MLSLLLSYISPLWKKRLPPQDAPVDDSSAVLSAKSAFELDRPYPSAELSTADAQLQRQCAEFSALTRRINNTCNLYLCTQPFTIGLPSLLMVLLWEALSRGEHQFAGLCLYLVPLAGFLALWVWIMVAGARISQRQREQAQTLAASGDLRVIGPLIDTFGQSGVRLPESAEDGLITLLSRIGPDDTDLLTARRRRLLCRRLEVRLPKAPTNTASPQQQAYEHAVALRIAILQALTHLGDSEALTIVTRLAQQEAHTEADRGLQEAAQNCLAAIARRVEQQRNPHLLLRASSVGDNEGQTLLHPVTSGPAENHTEQLLRPGPPV